MSQKIFFCLTSFCFDRIFRNDLLLSKPVKTLKEAIWKLIQPKGINRHGNIERGKLLDFKDEEIPLKDFREEVIDDGQLSEDKSCKKGCNNHFNQ